MTMLEVLFTFDGRIGRITFFQYWLLLLVVSIGAMIGTAYMFQDASVDEVTYGISLLFLWPNIAVLAKRLHDRGHSFALALLLFIPVVGLWVLVEAFLLPGSEGSNKYGSPPQPTRIVNSIVQIAAAFAVIAVIGTIVAWTAHPARWSTHEDAAETTQRTGTSVEDPKVAELEATDAPSNRAVQPEVASTGKTTTDSTEVVTEWSVVNAANEGNKQLPKDVGNDTRLDRIVAGPGIRMTYQLTLTNRTAKDVTPANISIARSAQIKESCNSKAIQEFLADGITVVYEYKMSDGTDFTSIELTPSVCVQ